MSLFVVQLEAKCGSILRGPIVKGSALIHLSAEECAVRADEGAPSIRNLGSERKWVGHRVHVR